MNGDVTKSVMQKVLRYEKKRTRWWNGIFVTSVTVLVCVFILSAFYVAKAFTDDPFSWLVTLYFTDSETLRNTWREAIGFVWDIVPHDAVYFALFVFAAIIVSIIVTASRRRVNNRRMQSVKQYLPKRRG